MVQWARVCDEVHRRGSYIYIQLWHLGRAARPHALAQAGLEMLSSSDVPITEEHGKPRPMTEDEIWDVIGQFADASKKAIEAGFDGVEIHGANGYLIDQFTQDVSNRRTDKWGGNVENRSRFAVEVAKAVCAAIGPERTGLRLSPFSDFQGMRMKDPVPQFRDLISRLRPLKLAFLHVVEPRVAGNVDRVEDAEMENLDFVREAWQKAGPIILAGGFTPTSANEALETRWKDEEVAIAFGRHFISNPVLPFRLANDIPLTPYDRNTFYKVKSRDGYTDYAFSEMWMERASVSAPEMIGTMV
jgi:NADPH2 dehydrogenase